MSFIYSRALAEEFWQDSFSGIGVYVQLNLSHMPKPCLLHDKTTERFPLSRFGMTCVRLEGNRGEALLTSWREGFRARTSVPQEQAPELKASEAGYGEKWPGLFARYSRDTSSWKTPQCSLLGDSDEFSETWPRWGSMRNGESFLRPIPALPICESGSGLWPTPTASLGNKGGRVTPSKAREGGTLIEALSARTMWPTPTRRDYRSDKCTPEVKKARDEHSRGKTLPWVVGGLLNPEWVEWLMGWPIGHTALKPLETAKYQEWLQQHGIYSASSSPNPELEHSP